MPSNSSYLDLSFEQSRNELAEAVRSILLIAQKRGLKRAEEEAAQLAEKLHDKQFNLLVLGEFKRGKSTLINALLEQEVMPVAVIPLTSVVTIASYGSKAKLVLVYENGQREESSIDLIDEFVSEERNPHNEKKISTVEIEFPSDFLRATGVRIIDTPGIGSIHEHNTEITIKYLPHADAAIFLFSADQPASKQELDFLKLASNHAVRLFFVQNKIDHLSQSEIEISSKFLAKALQKELSIEPDIYAVSAQKALSDKGLDSKDDFLKLREDLHSFLSKDKNRIFLESTYHKVVSLIKNLEQALELERKAVSLPPETLAKGIIEFRNCSNRIETEQDDTDYIVRGETKRLLAKIDQDLKIFAGNIELELIEATKVAYERNKALDKGDLVIAMKEELLACITMHFSTWKEEEESLVKELFDSITSRFVDRGNSIILELQSATRDLFQFELDTVFEIEPLSTKSMHSYAVYDPFTFAMENLPLLLPSPLAKPIIRQRFLQGAKSEGARNAGLLRADFQERIERSTLQFLSAFRANVRLIISEIEIALSRANSRHLEAESEKKRLDDELLVDIDTLKQLQKVRIPE